MVVPSNCETARCFPFVPSGEVVDQTHLQCCGPQHNQKFRQRHGRGEARVFLSCFSPCLNCFHLRSTPHSKPKVSWRRGVLCQATQSPLRFPPSICITTATRFALLCVCRRCSRIPPPPSRLLTFFCFSVASTQTLPVVLLSAAVNPGTFQLNEALYTMRALSAGSLRRPRLRAHPKGSCCYSTPQAVLIATSTSLFVGCRL